MACRFLRLCAVMICVLAQAQCESTGDVDAREENALEQFQLPGGLESHLFRECAAGANTVEGSLYSIQVTEGVEFVRRELPTTRDLMWSDVELTGEQGVIQCAQKAFELGKQVFKYDGQCQVSSLPVKCVPEEVDDCEPGEIVYIAGSLGEVNAGLTSIINISGCCSRIEYGNCVKMASGTNSSIAICQAYCEAQGFNLMGYEILKESWLELLVGTGGQGKTPVSYRRGEDGVWRWMPCGQTEELLPFATEPAADQNCALLVIDGDGSFEAVKCDDLTFTGYYYCFDLNTQRPPC